MAQTPEFFCLNLLFASLSTWSVLQHVGREFYNDDNWEGNEICIMAETTQHSLAELYYSSFRMISLNRSIPFLRLFPKSTVRKQSNGRSQVSMLNIYYQQSSNINANHLTISALRKKCYKVNFNDGGCMQILHNWIYNR